MVFTVLFHEYLLQFTLLLIFNTSIGLALVVSYSNEYLFLFLQAYFFYLETNNILINSLQSFFLFKITFSLVVLIVTALLSNAIFFLILGKVSLRRILFFRFLYLLALSIIGFSLVVLSFYSVTPLAIGFFSRLLPDYYYAYFFVVDLSLAGWSEFSAFNLFLSLFLLLTFFVLLGSALYLDHKNIIFLRIVFSLTFITLISALLPSDVVLHLIFVIIGFATVEVPTFLGLLIKEYCKLGRVA